MNILREYKNQNRVKEKGNGQQPAPGSPQNSYPEKQPESHTKVTKVRAYRVRSAGRGLQPTQTKHL